MTGSCWAFQPLSRSYVARLACTVILLIFVIAFSHFDKKTPDEYLKLFTLANDFSSLGFQLLFTTFSYLFQLTSITSSLL